jgi:hypothetical protein
MSKLTQLASGQITEAASITVELVEADETPAAVLVRWPSTARRTRGAATAVHGGRPGRWGRAGLRWLRAGR